MSNQHHRVRRLRIQDMTVDLFEFWLMRDWPRFARNVNILEPLKNPNKSTSQYIRSMYFAWNTDEDYTDNYTAFAWAQVTTNKIDLEIGGAGLLADDISKWLSGRFGINEMPPETEPSISDTSDLELTPTEAKVAGWLAEKLSYKEIGERLGKRTEAAARKHAQHIAKKWGTRQFIEVLQSEAQKRGYKTP